MEIEAMLVCVERCVELIKLVNYTIYKEGPFLISGRDCDIILEVFDGYEFPE
jgi:hypothetical protein